MWDLSWMIDCSTAVNAIRALGYYSWAKAIAECLTLDLLR